MELPMLKKSLRKCDASVQSANEADCFNDYEVK